jgi:drug efflux transport system permease protein
MNLRRTRAIARKEFWHILRDYRSLIAAIGMPLLLLALFGYALSLDVDRVPTAIYDEAHTAASQNLIQAFRGSRYFEVSTASSYAEIEHGIFRNTILIGVVIPRDYSRETGAGRDAQVQLLLDGSDSNTASLARGYAEGLVREHAATVAVSNLNRRGRNGAGGSIEPQVRTWYNSDMKSRNYIVPGLISVILMIIASLLTSLTIAKEWENGTMEQLLSTPVRPVELLFGKLSAYFALGVVDLLLSLGIGVFIFGTPFRGNLILLFAASFIFLFGALCWGLFLSAVTRSQHMAYQMATVTSFLPAFLLSGFIYSIEDMPAAVQAFTYAIPARYFVTILKGIFLKGVGLQILWSEFLFLTAYAAVVFLITTHKMRQKVA